MEPDSLELQLEAVMSHQEWVWELNLGHLSSFLFI